MTTRYDVIVLGAGPAGQVCAGALAEGGLRVAIVERELVGGECSYWGCIPSKTLVRPGEALSAVRDVPGAAGAVTGPLDVPSALAWRDFMVSSYDDTAATRWLTDRDIDVVRGEAAFLGDGAVRVGEQVLRADDIVVATGSQAVLPPVPGLRELSGVWTNREVTGLAEVPRRLIVLGGGPVGVEMAQALARMGSDVVLVEGAERILSREAAPLGQAVRLALEADGVDVRTGVRAVAALREGDDVVLELAGGDSLRGDRLLVATGRRPRLPAGLAALAVDERLQARDGLWAVGDVTGTWPLTYVGKYQARVAARNILGGDARASYDAVPRVVFSDPQAAAVGASGGPLTATVRLGDVARTATYTRAYDRTPGYLTLISDGERLTGAHAVGPEAGEWLQQATLAIRARVGLDVLQDTIQPFPTFSEAYVAAVAELVSHSPVAAGAPG